MVPEAPEDIVVVGDGALMAALTRSRGSPDARHRRNHPAPPGRGNPSAGPGRHRDHWRSGHRQDGRRPAPGGVPALLRPAPLRVRRHPRRGSLRRVHGVHRARAALARRGVGDAALARRRRRRHHRSPSRPARTRRRSRARCASGACSRRAARDVVPGAPATVPRLRGRPCDPPRRAGPRPDPRPGAAQPPAQPRRRGRRQALAEAAWASHREGDRAEFLDQFEDHLDVEAFMREWWPQVDPREVLLWIADGRARAPLRPGRPRSAARSPCSAESFMHALETGDLVGRRRRARRRPVARGSGPSQDEPREERGLLRDRGVRRPGPVTASPRSGQRQATPAGRPGAGPRSPRRPRASACSTAGIGRSRRVRPRARRRGPGPLADAVADARPPRAATRRGRSSVTPRRRPGRTPTRPAGPRAEAFGRQQRRLFHMDTNYRNAREIFDYAAEVMRADVPDADIPQAVRETGVDPVEVTVASVRLWSAPRARPSTDCSTRSRARRHRHPRRALGASCSTRRGRGGGRVQRRRPDVDQGPGVRRDGHRRPGRDQCGIARWRSRAVCGPHRAAHRMSVIRMS